MSVENLKAATDAFVQGDVLESLARVIRLLDAKDAEIERLKAQLEEASQRVNQTCFVCRRSYYDHAFRDEGSGACRQFTTGIEAGLRNTNDDLRAQLAASEEKRKVLANEALRKREQAAASERLQEFDQHASHAEKEGGLRAILLAEWVEARNAHAEAIKATDAAKALEAP